jgi:hypothetical protein
MSDVFERPVSLTAAQQREQEIARFVERHPRPKINEYCLSCGAAHRQFTVARLSSGELSWHCTYCKQPYRPPTAPSRADGGEVVAALPPVLLPPLVPEPPRQVLKHAQAELLAAAVELEHLGRALPAARATVERAEAAYAEAVAQQQAASARAADELEAVLRERPGGAPPRSGPDLAAKRRAVESAQDVLDTARAAASRVTEHEQGARRTLERRQHAHRNAALACLVAEYAPTLVRQAESRMAELVATLAALGWLVQQKIALPDGAGRLAEMRHTAPQHWPKAAQGTAAASAAMQQALDQLLRDPAAKVAPKLS